MTTPKLNRVAITGMGTISGCGNTLNETWENLVSGKSGISNLEHVNTDQVPVKFGGEVKNFTISEELISAKEAARYDRFIHFAMHAADEAVKTSGVLDADYKRDRIGAILGVGMGGFPEIERTHTSFMEKGPRRVSPFFIPAIIPNMASGLISIHFGIKGLNYTVASACASGAHAISSSCFEIMMGRLDAVITGGAESVFSNLTINGFANMKALSRFEGDPSRASRPFDTARDGFIMGEGAGVLVLENYDMAVARGATIYAEIVGHGASSDAYHITAPHPEGEGACQSMKQALTTANFGAGVDPSLVGYVNAHGTSTPLGDVGETKAIKKTFGDHAYKMYVSSTKSMTGHLLGAAGGIETIFCAMALHSGVLPPTINLDNQDPECDLNYVANKAIKFEAEYALNNSFGFGGTNSSLLLKKYRK